MKKLLVLASGHFVNDGIAGYLLGSLLYLQVPVSEIGIAVLIYNVIAFGGQIPFSIFIRKNYQPAKWLNACFLLLVLALVVFNFNYKVAILAAAISSAIIHVIGGYESSHDSEKAFGLGLFASPGVIGLAIGGFLASTHFNLLIYGLLACGLLILLVNKISFQSEIKQKENAMQHKIDSHDIIMILILAVIALRSAIWNVFQLVNENNYRVLVYIGLAAMLGKLAGGFLSDKMGHRKYNLIALSAAIPFLTILKNNVLFMCAGIFLLQSTFPSLSMMLISRFRENRYMGAAFSFGLPIILGALIFYTPMKNIMNTNMTIVSLILLSIILLLIEMRKRKTSETAAE